MRIAKRSIDGSNEGASYVSKFDQVCLVFLVSQKFVAYFDMKMKVP